MNEDYAFFDRAVQKALENQLKWVDLKVAHSWGGVGKMCNLIKVTVYQ